MKYLKRTAFGLAGATVLLLTAATLIEKYRGTEFVAAHVYRAPAFVALWGLLGATALAYVLRRKLRRAALLLHLALAIILAGAFTTWLFGEQGTLHLRTDGPAAEAFTDSDGRERPFPFRVSLGDFRVEYYPGTQAPMDFVSELAFATAGKTDGRVVSMNRIATCRHYRFYQAGYDADGLGATLAVAYDPWGIGITYAGYLLLLAAMVYCLANRQGRFRRLLRHPALRGGTLTLLFSAAAFSARAAETGPRTLPRGIAGEMGALHVYYNDRICPLSTLAREFTAKLYGKSSYHGFSAEQVLSGWLFFYDDWKAEPIIRIKSAEARRLLGLEGRYARLTDFRNAVNEYRLRGESADRGLREADEKFNLIGMVCSGSMLKLFPYTDPGDKTLRWASQTDDLPTTLPHEQWTFIRRAMDYANELVVRRDYDALETLLEKIGVYQQKQCGERLPARMRFRAELLYNRIAYTFPAAVGFVLAGLLGFAAVCRRTLQKKPGRGILRRTLAGALWAGWIYLTVLLVLRGYVCGHWPMSNGFETMQFMAWCTWLLTLLFHRRFALLLPMGLLVGGLAMMVSVMGASNPQITPLMPVLNSPLLSIHVMLVMAAYSLLALVALNGIAGLIAGRRHRDAAEQLQLIGRIMLYPAVFCLAAGIFVGAVWANVSWGRYWGWDPKEVWALITLLVYAAALHTESLPRFRRPAFFHVFCVAAFLTVLITYFGVNFLLGGMHSYAG